MLSPSVIHGFAFHRFSYPQSTKVRKYYMENSRSKEFIRFKLCTILSSLMKSHAILLQPARVVNYPFVQVSTVYMLPP